jgi:hypothetical protein
MLALQETAPGLAMATALKLPEIERTRSDHEERTIPMPSARYIFGMPHGHQTTDIFVNSGRFQAVKTARSQGEVYIHEHDHGSVTSSRASLFDASPRPSLRERKATHRMQQGEVRARMQAARRIAEYRATHAFPVRNPYPESEPALPLWKLSDEFRKSSPRRQRFSPGSRPLMFGTLGGTASMTRLP